MAFTPSTRHLIDSVAERFSDRAIGQRGRRAPVSLVDLRTGRRERLRQDDSDRVSEIWDHRPGAAGFRERQSICARPQGHWCFGGQSSAQTPVQELRRPAHGCGKIHAVDAEEDDGDVQTTRWGHKGHKTRRLEDVLHEQVRRARQVGPNDDWGLASRAGKCGLLPPGGQQLAAAGGRGPQEAL